MFRDSCLTTQFDILRLLQQRAQILIGMTLWYLKPSAKLNTRGTLLYKLYRYGPPQRVLLSRRFGLTLPPILFWIRVFLRKTTGLYERIGRFHFR